MRGLIRIILVLSALSLSGCFEPGFGGFGGYGSGYGYPAYGYAPYSYGWPFYGGGYRPDFRAHRPWEQHHAYGHPGSFLGGSEGAPHFAGGFGGRALGGHFGGGGRGGRF